jgi:transcriptional regulator GlxA family with amidase domain
MCVFYQTPAQEAVPAWHGRLRSLTEWIAAHCEEKITVPDLARRVGTTPKSLESAFRIVLGTSVSGFVATQRLSRARRLLETTDKTIAAIAAECGYCDHSHFIKAFRGRWGRPPGEYRAAIRSVSSEKIHL